MVDLLRLCIIAVKRSAVKKAFMRSPQKRQDALSLLSVLIRFSECIRRAYSGETPFPVF